MAVHRKSRNKQPLHFRDGGAVPMSADVAVDPAAAQPDGAATLQATSREEEPSPVMAALNATLAAEGLQREAARIRREMEQRPASQPQPPTSIDEYIDRLPISDHKRAFLRSNPALLEPSRSRVLADRYADAIKAGIPDDSPELDEYLLAGVQRGEERLQRSAPPMSPPAVTSAPAPSRRPSMPITAPVSRESIMPDGRMYSDRITLSAEERQMAHLSYRHLPPGEAEQLYATQKMKLARERAAGRYPERERG